MRKLNNKGMTTVEVLVCFVLTVIIVVSMYSSVSTYATKRTLESNREEIIKYKNILTKDIMSDLTINGLVSATIDPSNISDNKTLQPAVDASGNDTYTVTFTLRGGITRELTIKKRTAYSSNLGGYNNYDNAAGNSTITTEEYYFGDANMDEEINDQDCVEIQNCISNPTSCDSDSFKAGIIKGVDATKGTYQAAKDYLCDSSNKVIESSKNSLLGRNKFRRSITVTPSVDSTDDVNDNFMITYNGINYPLPNIGQSKNDNDKIIYDLRIGDVNISTDDNVLNIHIALQHRDFGNKYAINIVYPYNF